jgi:hypothetical protein
MRARVVPHCVGGRLSSSTDSHCDVLVRSKPSTSGLEVIANAAKCVRDSIGLRPLPTCVHTGRKSRQPLS